MLSDYISPGNRIELHAYTGGWKESDSKRVYASKVYDIMTDESMDVMMPVEQGQLQLVPLDSVYNVVFYAEKGLFECYARVADRYRSANMYILTLDITSPLQKLQRREYYRFSCSLNLYFRLLTQEEEDILRDNPFSRFEPGDDLKKAFVVDISGGGLRFVSDELYEPGSRIFMTFKLPAGGMIKDYMMLGRIILSDEIEGRPGTFEHRVQYTNIDEDNREDIIH